MRENSIARFREKFIEIRGVLTEKDADKIAQEMNKESTSLIQLSLPAWFWKNFGYQMSRT